MTQRRAAGLQDQMPLQDLMNRILIVLLLSVVGTVILFVGAGMHGGMCHCSTAMFALFPIGSYVTMRTSWESVGLLLVLVQFPLYAVIVTLVNGTQRRVIVLLLVIVFHVLAASLAVYDYCQSRRRCELAPSANPSTLAQTKG